LIVPETNLGMLGHRGDPVTEDVWSLLSLLSPGGRGIRSGANYHRLLTRYDDSLDTALMFGVCDGSADLTAVSPMCGHCRDKDDDPPHPVTIITTRSSIQGQETLSLSLSGMYCGGTVLQSSKTRAKSMHVGGGNGSRRRENIASKVANKHGGEALHCIVGLVLHVIN
jgi:hypothetical protein